MAQFVLDIPDESLATVTDAFCLNFGADMNAVKPGDFLASKIVEYIKRIVSEYQSLQAAELAKAVAAKSISDIPITVKWG